MVIVLFIFCYRPKNSLSRIHSWKTKKARQIQTRLTRTGRSLPAESDLPPATNTEFTNFNNKLLWEKPAKTCENPRFSKSLMVFNNLSTLSGSLSAFFLPFLFTQIWRFDIISRWFREPREQIPYRIYTQHST